MLIKSSNSILNILFKPIYYEREKYFLLHKSNLKAILLITLGIILIATLTRNKKSLSPAQFMLTVSSFGQE